jgi:hypothetical protein
VGAGRWWVLLAKKFSRHGRNCLEIGLPLMPPCLVPKTRANISHHMPLDATWLTGIW